METSTANSNPVPSTQELLLYLQPDSTQSADTNQSTTTEQIPMNTTTTPLDATEQHGENEEFAVYQQPISQSEMKNMFTIASEAPAYSIDLGGLNPSLFTSSSSTSSTSSVGSSTLSSIYSFSTASSTPTVPCHCPPHLITCPVHGPVEQGITKRGPNAGKPYHSCRKGGKNCDAYKFRFDECGAQPSVAAPPVPSSTQSTGCTCNQPQNCPRGHGLMPRRISKSAKNPGRPYHMCDTCKEGFTWCELVTCTCTSNPLCPTHGELFPKMSGYGDSAGQTYHECPLVGTCQCVNVGKVYCATRGTAMITSYFTPSSTSAAAFIASSSSSTSQTKASTVVNNAMASAPIFSSILNGIASNSSTAQSTAAASSFPLFSTHSNTTSVNSASVAPSASNKPTPTRQLPAFLNSGRTEQLQRTRENRQEAKRRPKRVIHIDEDEQTLEEERKIQSAESAYLKPKVVQKNAKQRAKNRQAQMQSASMQPPVFPNEDDPFNTTPPPLEKRTPEKQKPKPITPPHTNSNANSNSNSNQNNVSSIRITQPHFSSPGDPNPSLLSLQHNRASLNSMSTTTATTTPTEDQIRLPSPFPMPTGHFQSSLYFTNPMLSSTRFGSSVSSSSSSSSSSSLSSSSSASAAIGSELKRVTNNLLSSLSLLSSSTTLHNKTHNTQNIFEEVIEINDEACPNAMEVDTEPTIPTKPKFPFLAMSESLGKQQMLKRFERYEFLKHNALCTCKLGNTCLLCERACCIDAVLVRCIGCNFRLQCKNHVFDTHDCARSMLPICQLLV